MILYATNEARFRASGMQATIWLWSNLFVVKRSFRHVYRSKPENKRTALRSRQDSNLRGETPMDF